jgi:hypothetical protein
MALREDFRGKSRARRPSFDTFPTAPVLYVMGRYMTMSTRWHGRGKAGVGLVALGMILAALAAGVGAQKSPTTQPAGTAADKPAGSQPSSGDANTDLNKVLSLPMAKFIGTPEDLRTDEPNDPLPRPGTRAKFFVPAGVKNVALGRKVTGSEEDPVVGKLKQVTDGDKEAREGSFVELGPGKQWVQIDLEKEHKILAVVVWHHHLKPRFYKDVIVQLSDDPNFVEKTIIYNTDHDNTSGFGEGKDRAYVETNEGRLIDGQGVKARYVRLYSRGNSENDLNNYTEVEVYALPGK